MELLDLFLALTPILLILVLMLKLRWQGVHAGLVTWAVTVMIAGLRFGAGPSVLWAAQIRGLFLAGYVLYIIWGALFFYRTTAATGTIAALGEVVRRLSPNRALQMLLLAWCLASFLQGVGGFGVPVAVVAPLLAGMGFPPVASVVLPSLGHAWAVSFGSLGSSFFALLAATGLDGAVIAPWAALYLGLVCLVVGATTLWVAGGQVALRQAWIPWLLIGFSMAGVQWGAARIGLWNIAAMLGSLAGLLVGSGWALFTTPQNWRSAELRGLLRTALLPYGILLLLILAVKFLPALRTTLDSVTLQVELPAVSTARGWTVPAGATRSISLWGHTGALLSYVSLLVGWWGVREGRLQTDDLRKIWRQVSRSGLSSTLGILSLVALATTMEYSGMITLLATRIAQLAGQFFPLLSPFVGALGAFITGSNTNSNVLFGALQRDIAQTLGYATPVLLAAQNAGGALGSVFAPAKVIVGCSTVGLSGEEGQVMRRLLRYELPVLGALGLLTWVLTR